MGITLTSTEKTRLEAGGFLGMQITGGPEKRKYYLPDGRPIFAIPGERQYVIKDKDGKVIEKGTRDANLDKGWLMSPPSTLKIYCPGCDGWHDTQKEVKGCQMERAQKQKRLERRGLKLLRKGDNITDDKDEIATLKAKLEKLEAIITKLAGGNGGGIL